MPLFLAACVLSAQASAPREPKAIVEFLYAHPAQVYTHAGKALSARFFSPTLVSLYRQDRQSHTDEVPNLDFDFLSNSQDPEVSQVVAAVKLQDANRQTITVHFLEMKDPQALEYDFTRLKGTWLIDEVRCPTKGNAWVLSEILKGRP